MLASACGSTLGATSASAPTPSATSATTCQPTSSRDADGVFTSNGVYGVLGDTSMASAIAMNEPLVIVHKGAKAQDTLALQFNSVGNSSPATSVWYGVGARARPNAWSEFAFEAGWKPIGFAGSCWRLIADGDDTGLVLSVRP
jgi:hypothetical protein